MNLLEIKQLSSQQLRNLIEIGLQNPEAAGSPLLGKTAALIFEKPSARTRLVDTPYSRGVRKWDSMYASRWRTSRESWPATTP